MRSVAVCVLYNAALRVLVVLVECTVRCNRIVSSPILLWHRTLGWRHTLGRKADGLIHAKPLDVLLACVCLVSIAELVFEQKLLGQLDKPAVIVEALANPDPAGMVRMRGLVAASWCAVDVRRLDHVDRQNPVRGVQNLTALDNHLDHMLVAVPASTATRIGMQEEDVHFVPPSTGAGAGAGFVFS